jgi:endonuclease/exonuclease/phosphatase family metal-dependent hydrolase
MMACDPFHTKLGDEVEQFQSESINFAEFPDTLKVMTWNIKFGGGRIDFFFDCHGDRVIMTKEEVEQNMAEVAKRINEINPDILFLQEVDINSKRSAKINQLQYILDNTQLNYGTYASQWKASYIPSEGLGRMDSGNAILSKWELKEAHRIALPLIKEQNFLVRYFYLKRNLMEASLEHPNGKLMLLNTHASAYAKDNTKKLQLDIIKKHIDSLNQQGMQFILAGDFNSLPPYTQQLNDFDDAACTGGAFDANDYSKETDWMVPFYENYQAAIPLNEYKLNNKPYFSHTTDKKGFWNRKLDYIFANRNFEPGTGITHQKWMQSSDHAPITAFYSIKQ